jgi:hypothetical protein
MRGSVLVFGGAHTPPNAMRCHSKILTDSRGRRVVLYPGAGAAFGGGKRRRRLLWGCVLTDTAALAMAEFRAYINVMSRRGALGRDGSGGSEKQNHFGSKNRTPRCISLTGESRAAGGPVPCTKRVAR